MPRAARSPAHEAVAGRGGHGLDWLPAPM
eukprot:COSAG02_NODE_16383_length_1088_cov_0.822042_1_plen_28_part_10